MQRAIHWTTVCLAPAVVSIAAWANSGSLPSQPNPVLKRTGAEVDGGLNCTACHRGADANSDTRGKFQVIAGNYTPGVPQTIRVEIEHPTQSRWGFQLTARPVSAGDRMAGSFTPSDAVTVRCDDGMPNTRGTPPPCGGRLEFASHTAASTRPGTRNGVSWDIEWTPPDSEVGDIMFYAAGNAADNSGTNSGDIIYTTALRIQVQGACPTNQRPTLRSVVNAASFQPGLATNSLISLFGLGFHEPGGKRAVGLGDIRDGKFPTELACVAVEVAGQRVPVSYVQADQINAQAPTLALTGPVEVRVILNPGKPNEIRSEVAAVTMQEYMPAFFTFPGGRGIAAKLPNSATLIADPAAFQGARPALPGEVIELYGTGFGVTEPVYQAGETVPLNPVRLRDQITVTVGGVTLAPEDVLYAGLAPGAITGLYQINIRVPSSASDGDVPVVARVGGVSTQANLTVPVKRP